MFPSFDVENRRRKARGIFFSFGLVATGSNGTVGLAVDTGADGAGVTTGDVCCGAGIVTLVVLLITGDQSSFICVGSTVPLVCFVVFYTIGLKTLCKRPGWLLDRVGSTI